MSEERDILEVLREAERVWTGSFGHEHGYRYKLAADEIERLRSEIKTLEMNLRHPDR